MAAGVKLINSTDENLRIAVFKLPYMAPSLNLVAWKIIALPNNGGNKTITIPNQYEVYINYPEEDSERSDPYGGVHTSHVKIDQSTARFIVRNELTNDGKVHVATLKRVFFGLVNSEIHIENRAGFGVWGHIMLNGEDIYQPQIISPGRTLMENIESPLYVSVIDEFVSVGSVVKVRELRSRAVEINTGDDVIFAGSKWDGYIINGK
ncbi:MAG: hypothetical protein PVH88_20340 [Ignavibacteria bacterium]|jgi:hypothetical protein